MHAYIYIHTLYTCMCVYTYIYIYIYIHIPVEDTNPLSINTSCTELALANINAFRSRPTFN